jgi:hypothetical protein
MANATRCSRLHVNPFEHEIFVHLPSTAQGFSTFRAVQGSQRHPAGALDAAGEMVQRHVEIARWIGVRDHLGADVPIVFRIARVSMHRCSTA